MATQEQIGCIFCGKSVIRDKINLKKFDNWDISWKVFQVRQMLPGPGRGKRGKNADTGFPAIKDAGLSILQMMDDPAYADIVQAIKKRLVKIVRAYIKAGIIKPSELRVPKS